MWKIGIFVMRPLSLQAQEELFTGMGYRDSTMVVTCTAGDLQGPAQNDEPLRPFCVLSISLFGFSRLHLLDCE